MVFKRLILIPSSSKILRRPMYVSFKMIVLCIRHKLLPRAHLLPMQTTGTERLRIYSDECNDLGSFIDDNNIDGGGVVGVDFATCLHE